jgi:hypothetical protein
MRTGAFSPQSGWEPVGFVDDGLTTGCRRTGGQRWFGMQWPRRTSGVVSPPPLNPER